MDSHFWFSRSKQSKLLACMSEWVGELAVTAGLSSFCAFWTEQSQKLGKLPLSGSDSGRYMLWVHGSSTLGYLNARSPIAITRLLRTEAGTALHHFQSFTQKNRLFLGRYQRDRYSPGNNAPKQQR